MNTAAVAVAKLNHSSDRIESMTQTYLGPVMLSLLADPTVMDIMYRPGWVTIDRAGVGLESVPEAIGTVRLPELLRLFGPLMTLQVPDQTEVVELSLPGFRARFAGFYVGRDGSQSFCTIRRATVHGLSLAEYVTRGVFDQQTYAYLRQLLRTKTLGLLIAGATGSGKTMLLGSLIREILQHDKHEHLLIVEDTPELWIDQDNITTIVATPRTDYRAALRAALRHRPDRIIVGEVRGGEALDAVKAGSTGHGLMMTIHADSAKKAIRTLCSRVAEGTNGHVDFQLVAQAIQTVIVLQRRDEKFLLTEISTLEAIHNDEIAIKKVYPT